MGQPGADLFFIVARDWLHEDHRLQPVIIKATLKVGATLRY